MIFEDFVGRADEAKRLSVAMASGINSALAAPPGWGKSALASESARRLLIRDETVVIGSVDLTGVRSESGFCNHLCGQLLEAAFPAGDQSKALHELLPGLRNEPALGNGRLEFDFHPSDLSRTDIHDFPQRLSQAKKARLVVLFEPFEIFLTAVERSAQIRWREAWKKHRNVSYCLSGNLRMEESFSRRESPFYRFCDLVVLKKVPRETWVSHISLLFRENGKAISHPVASALCGSVDDHPGYIRELAEAAWFRADVECTNATLQGALRHVLSCHQSQFRGMLLHLSDTQVNLLRAVAAGVERFTSVLAMNRFALGTPRNVAKNREILKNAGIIEPRAGRLQFVDPLFARWLQTVL